MMNADLFFQQGSSDKEYHIQLEDKNGSYSVHAQWGRRGSTLQSQTKIEDAGYDQALKVYEKLLKQKVGKGYILDESTSTESENNAGLQIESENNSDSVKVSPEYFAAPLKRKIRWKSDPLIPQLLNPISDCEDYLKDDSWGMQEKKDGKHVMVRKDNTFTVYNKKGKEIGYPKKWDNSITIPTIIDGEAIGNTLHAFDCIEINGKNLRTSSYETRYNSLKDFGPAIKVVPLAIGYKAKKKLFDKLVAENKEGVVFKKLDAPYTPGRPNKGGTMLKFKFYATASVRVCTTKTGKHSVGMELLDKGKWIKVGNVTIGQSTDLPIPGSIIEVRYLYAYPKGSLYQPTFLGLRDDVDEDECTTNQLKYKSNED